jgi:3-deoxy-D-manno-octulosonic-acid transferase
MARRESVYEAAMRAAGPLLTPVSAIAGGKLRRGVHGRRESLDVLCDWGDAHRDPARPLAWLHAPSVGEALMAQAIIAALRERRPDVQIAFTFFSPSAERVLNRLGADVAAYLPWDTAAAAHALLGALRPSAIAFVRTEIWPVLTREAEAADVPALLVNAVLSEGSGRLGSAARFLLGPAYARLAAIGAADAEDGARFQRLGAPAHRIHVTGDARFDQVEARIRTLDPGVPLLARLRAAAAPVLVAGSTWGADHERLLPALAPLAAHGRLHLVLAPHEPSAAQLRALEAALVRAGIVAVRLSAFEAAPDAPPPPALIVDRLGVLADLYSVAALAWVGGGFGTDGLHSVVEPAALGVPVLYGPRFGNSQEARRLADAGGGFVVTDGDALLERVGILLGTPGVHAAAATAARHFVEARLGGAGRNADLIASRWRT